MKFGSFWARSRRSVQIDTWSSFCSAVRRRGTNFADTRLICTYSVRIFWHVPNAIPTSSATSLIVRRQSAQITSCTCAMVSSVWEVDGLPGRESSSKDRRPFLKREYHSNVFDRLRQHSESCLQHFVCFSTGFPQTETEIDAHTLLNFLLHREMRRTPQIDVHLEASTERMQGDTGFQLCKYTCTELPPVLPCCHFAAYYSFPEKKSVPELNDQPTYVCMYGWMYVCTYVGTCVCIYVCMYIYMYVRMYVCIYVCIYICMYVHMYVCAYVCTCICMYVYMYVRTYIRMCMYICICMYVYVYIYIHTHTHICCIYVCLYVCMYVCTYVCM